MAEAGVMKIQLMHRDLTFYTVFVPRIWFQVSAQPPAKQTAGLIEKETYFPLWGIVGHETHEITRKQKKCIKLFR